MEWVDAGQVAQVLLAVVLGVSGAAKLLDPAGTARAAVDLGVPRRLAPLVSRLLPLTELAAAALLLLLPRAGVPVALLLLLAFTLLVAVALARGRRPSCGCFGRLGGSEVSGQTLARNGVLLAAGLGALLAGPARPSWASSAAGAALGAGLLALEALDGQRARRRELAVLEASLGSSSPAPDFAAPLLNGGTASRASLLAAGRPLLLVVLSPGCGGCTALVPVLRRWAQAHGAAVTLAVAVAGDQPQAAALVGDLAVPVLLDPETEVSDAFGLLATPAAILLTSGGRQVGQQANGPDGVRRLLEAALAAAGAEPVDPASLGPAFVPVPAQGVRVEPQDTGALLVDDLTGARLQVDALGATIWSVLDGQASVAELTDELAEAFGVPRPQVEVDLLHLLRQLGAAGLLDGVQAVPVAQR